MSYLAPSSANESNKPVRRDASGNFAAGTISANLSGSATAIDGVTVTGTPSTGQVITATSSTTADWQTPSGGSGNGPTWTKYTATYQDLALNSGGGSTSVYDIAALDAKEIVHGVVIKHSTAFAGGALTSYTISLGVIGSEIKYASVFDVFTSVTPTNAQISSGLNMESFTSQEALTLFVTSTGDTLNNAAAGSVDVWILTSTLP